MKLNTIMRLNRFFFLLLFVATLNACTTTSELSDSNIDRSEQLLTQGKYADAAEQLVQMAESASGIVQQRLLLRSVAALARSEQLPKARAIFKSITPVATDPELHLLYSLTQAHIAIAERQPNAALEALDITVAPQTQTNLKAEYHDLRALAYTMLGNRIEIARELVLREVYLQDPALIKTNQHDIWQALASMTERALQQLRTAPPPDTLSGWMHLIQIAKANQLRPIALKQALLEWRQLYANHPVQEQFLAGLMERREEDVAYPTDIALLLPMTGKFNLPAQAIRDGFLAAYYSRNQQNEQKIRIYDVGESGENILQVYQTALDNGAKMVIGPLNKDAVVKLAEDASISVPTLSLNYLPENAETTRKLFQFGLSPEEEAMQVAERTWLDGHVKAAVLVPSGPWGERVYQVFKQRWEHMGGEIIEMQTYDATRNDYSLPIKRLLDIDDSKTRYRRISTLIEQDVKFTTRRREDIDFIFVAAFPRQARAIRPQLKFFHASEIPVYATSHAFTGNLNPEKDRDMDGLVFGDMPWVLAETTLHRGMHTKLEGQISAAGNNLQRLYALGIDAYNIIGALNTLKTYPYERFDGETGSLSLDTQQRIRRQLTWVKFRSGQPIPIESGIR